MSDHLRTSVVRELRRNELSYVEIWRSNSRLQTPPENCRRLPQEFHDALFIFDFCKIWIDRFTILAFYSLFSRKKNRDLTVNQVRSVFLTSARVGSDLSAIRLMVFSGFDVQARQIARTVSETVDALGRAILDAEFCDSFVEKQDIEESNQVWYKYVSKSKAREHVYRAVEQRLATPNLLDEQRRYRSQEETALGAAVHPSFISGFVSLVPHFAEEEDGATNSDVSANSIRTLSFCASRLLECMTYDLAILNGVERLSQNVGKRLRKIDTATDKAVATKFRPLALALAMKLHGASQTSHPNSTEGA